MPTNPDFDKLVGQPTPLSLTKRPATDRAGYFAYYAYNAAWPTVAWELLAEAERRRWRQAADAAIMSQDVGEPVIPPQAREIAERGLVGAFNGEVRCVPADLSGSPDQPFTREAKGDAHRTSP